MARRVLSIPKPGEAPRINYAPSARLARAVPWVTILLACMAPALPFIASAPLMPPLGAMMLIAWRHLRPGLLPVWAGFPIGLFDDIWSGQPFGSAILLYSLIMLALEVIDFRMPWRNFAMNWLIAALLISGLLMAQLAIANAAGAASLLAVTGPQLIVSILTFPIVARVVAAFDRWRLIPISRVS